MPVPELKTPQEIESAREILMDHRQGIRLRSLVLAEIQPRYGQPEAGIIYDISSNGMFVISRARPGVNKCINVVFSAPRDRSARITGLVVHQNEHGFGLMFQQLQGEARTFVENHLTTHRCRAAGRP